MANLVGKWAVVREEFFEPPDSIVAYSLEPAAEDDQPVEQVLEFTQERHEDGDQYWYVDQIPWHELKICSRSSDSACYTCTRYPYLVTDTILALRRCSL